MNQSPNSIADCIKVMNANKGQINIIGFNNKNYVTESNMLAFMKAIDVESMDIGISNIHEFFGIDDVNVITESETDLDLIMIDKIVSLIESLDVREVINASKGPNKLLEFIDQAAAFITGHKYDKTSELENYIAKCDRLLDDIAEEKKIAKDKDKNDSYKFTLTYIYNIAKNVFTIFIAPAIVTKNIKLPAAVAKLFNEKLIKKTISAGIDIEKWKKIGKVSFTANQIIDSGVPSDLKNLYLSINDYEKLLCHYEYKIKSVKAGLQYQLQTVKLAENEEKKMNQLKEDYTNPEVTKVHFVSPEDLVVNTNEPHEDRDVFHDDKDIADGAPVAPDIDADKAPIEGIEKHMEPTVLPTPVDAINQAHCKPSNVLVTKLGDKYYIDFKDLKTYMDAIKSTDCDKAVDDIISANNDPDFKTDCLRVVMSGSELEGCSAEQKKAFESASVEFEVYK